MKRYSELFLADTVETNGELYYEAVENNYDLQSFTEFYLNSELRRLLDDGNALYLTMLGKELLEELEDTDHCSQHVNKTNVQQDPFMAEWLGEFYTLLQWKLGIYSKECAEKYLPEKLMRWYNTLHDMDMELAIQRVTEA